MMLREKSEIFSNVETYKYIPLDMLFLLSFEHEIGSHCESEVRQFLIYSFDPKKEGKLGASKVIIILK